MIKILNPQKNEIRRKSSLIRRLDSVLEATDPSIRPKYEPSSDSDEIPELEEI